MVKNHPTANLFEPALYRICIMGHLDTNWSDYFGGMAIEQSALLGVLNSLHDIGCPIVSVEYVAGE
jgi:hypothetical protein